MQFVIYAKDKPNAAELRQATREAHIAYVRGSGKMLFGKPLLNDEGGMIGSLVRIEAANRAEADEFVANDPYSKAGLFETLELTAIAE